MTIYKKILNIIKKANKIKIIFIVVGIFLLGMMFKNIEKRWYQKVGVSNGYILFSPMYSRETYLVDESGKIAHKWKSQDPPGNAVYMLKNGDILRTASSGLFSNKEIYAPGAGEYIERISWDNKLIWKFKYSDDKSRMHHDIKELPNGNILMIAWEKKTKEEAILAGRNSNLIKDGYLLPDSIIEIKPIFPNNADIVWKWSVWDHLIQDQDRNKKNYGNVSEHPELIDINFLGIKDQADWNHLNSIDYNEKLDQILLSSREFGEIWIIDHSTTQKEAASHFGGRSGKGGDILYRWGNPYSYKKGSENNKKLFGQHDAQWIKKGLLGEDNILIFNNGDTRYEGKYSSIEEIIPEVDDNGLYKINNEGFYGPKESAWMYSEKNDKFYSQFISGVQRLPNGNTFICSGGTGDFFEVDNVKKIIWKYKNNFYDSDIFNKNLADQMTLNGFDKKQANIDQKKPAISNSSVFKARWYPKDFIGFSDKNI